MSTNPHSAPRSLPERPDLRHLKDQAKDFLKGNSGQDEIPKSLADAHTNLPVNTDLQVGQSSSHMLNRSMKRDD